MSESTTARRLTQTTWEGTLAGQYLTRDRARGEHKINGEYPRPLFWTDQHDLADELAARSALTGDEARSLVSHVCSGLPVVLTWKHRLNGPTGQADGAWEVTRTTVIVNELGAPHADPTRRASLPGSVRLSYSGFGHPIYLTQILAVEQVDKSVTFHHTEPVKGQPLPEEH